MREMPKGFYHTMLLILFTFSAMCVIYINDTQGNDKLTIEVLQDKTNYLEDYNKTLHKEIRRVIK